MEPLDELSRWFCHRGSYEVGIMLADHIRYLREKAAHLRRAARNYPRDLAQRLTDLATEFEAKATEMEASQPGNRAPN